MPALNIKYFDESSAQWGMRRPATNQMTRNTFSFLCLAVGGRGGAEEDAKKIASLANLIQSHAPTFIILNEVTAPFYELIKDNATVRAGYGVTEFSANSCNMLVDGVVKPAEHASCFLVAHYVPLPFAEHKIKGDFNSEYTSRPFAVMYIRGFLGLQFAIGALHFDPLNIVATRATSVSKCLEKVDPNEVTLLFANFLESVSTSIRADLPNVLDKMPLFQWSDVQKLQVEGVPNGADSRREPSALWMRRTEATPVVVQSSTSLKLDEFSYSSLTLFRAGQSQSSSSSPAPTPSGITIPQPRSAKADPKASQNPITDPAVVSVDKSPSTLPQAGTNGSQQQQTPQQQRPAFPGQPFRPARRWFTDRVTHIRRPPDHDERDYDLGMFKSVEDAVRALTNGSFQWNFDYLIIGSNLLYCDGAKPSYPAFKRYCSEHLSQMNQWRRENNLPTGKAARLAAQRQPAAPLDVGSEDANGTATANSTPPPAQQASPKQDVLAASAPSIPSSMAFVGNTTPSASGNNPQQSPVPAATPSGGVTKQPSLPMPFVPRQRVWSEHSATIIYQTTPLELRFDISAYVGQAKNNLAVAIERLNSRKKVVDVGAKVDPLATYAHDYALLFNPERQAYWLISCVDVPCDIVACRNHAYRLSCS